MSMPHHKELLRSSISLRFREFFVFRNKAKGVMTLLCQFEKMIYPSGTGAVDAASFMIALYRPCEKLKDSSGNTITQIKAVGYCLPTASNMRYEMRGHWRKDPKYGIQYDVEGYEEQIIPTREGIVAYLSSGQIKGIGPKMAERIYDAFGNMALEVLDKKPEMLLTISGISQNKLKKICDSYLANRGARDVVAFLSPHGITPNRAVKLYKEYGEQTMDIVKNHPYKLCEMVGVGFKTADKIAMNLYALYTGIPRDEVRKAILARMGVPENASRPRQKILPKADTECPLTDIDARHATYSALLSKLTLASDHRDNLLGRGLTDADIERLGYKTTPVVGMTQIAKQLQSDGLYLAGVPGFYRDDSGAWTFIHEKRGILIPVRDHYGRIQGLQNRRDNVEKRKFRWVSSTEKKDGCKAEGWTHLSGPVRPMLVLTEGPMKADVINALTGLTVLAVPGVNTLTQLELTLTELRSEGLVEIKTAFDMDFATNHHVQNGYNNLLQLLGDMGFRYGTYLWDPAYKGLDDYIWEYLFRKKQSQ